MRGKNSCFDLIPNPCIYKESVYNTILGTSPTLIFEWLEEIFEKLKLSAITVAFIKAFQFSAIVCISVRYVLLLSLLFISLFHLLSFSFYITFNFCRRFLKLLAIIAKHGTTVEIHYHFEESMCCPFLNSLVTSAGGISKLIKCYFVLPRMFCCLFEACFKRICSGSIACFSFHTCPADCWFHYLFLYFQFFYSWFPNFLLYLHKFCKNLCK